MMRSPRNGKPAAEARRSRVREARAPDASVLPDDILETMVQGLTPEMPPREHALALRNAVLDRIRAPQRFLTVRTTDGEWLAIAPGVAVKHLQDDGTMQSFLLRLDAGARVPAHDHPVCDEHCIVMEGTARLGDVTVHRGDYHVAYAGSRHADITSDTGAILFLRTASGTMPQPSQR